MEIKCLECGKAIPQTAGKRKKEYCGATCRTKYWKKKKDAGKEKKGPGRPQKDTNSHIHITLPSGAKASVSPDVSPEVLADLNTMTEIAAKMGDPTIYMGKKIPKGLKGIDLSIWKAEIKENFKK